MNTHAQRRPLSPHLQVYHFPLTAILSIAHRITGALLALGNVVLVAWVAAVAVDARTYGWMHALFVSLPGRIALVAWSLMLYFHLCNGVRHLFWDAGWGFDTRTVDLTAIAALAGTVTLTALTWWLFWGAA